MVFYRPVVDADMRFRNISKLAVPKSFWFSLANMLDLGGLLPGAVRDELGMYDACKYLRVTINKRLNRRQHDRPQTFGSYSFGSISLFPDLADNPASLTETYLHELCHAWLHQYREVVYEQYDTCPLCEDFAVQAFKALGGKRRLPDDPASYSLDVERAATRIDKFADVAERLTSLSEAELKALLH